MAELSVFWTNTALKQRNYTFEYWNDRNKSATYSKKLNSSIKERTNILKTNPELGKKTELNNTRVISLGHYSILYRKVESKIIITGFWDNRQNPDKLLKFLTQE
ncbi:MAG: type II toxin-antitoxin system RelE/ParE family toxin [Lutibacter sp.]|jgi:plasmid stabilization system protein ParE